MEGNMMHMLGFLCGLIVACIATVIVKKGFLGKCKYDERQQIVRGKGFRSGFFGWMMFNGIYIVADIGFEIEVMDTSLAMFSGMLIGAVICVSYCIWNEGYFSLNDNPKRVIIVLAAIALLNGICSIYAIHKGVLLQNGTLTFLYGSNLFCALASVLILMIVFLKWGVGQRKEE